MNIICNLHNIIIKRNSEIILIELRDILFIEKFGNKCFIKTKIEELEIRISLNNIDKILPEYFVRSHRSYIVNVKIIRKIENMPKSNLYKVFFINNKEDYALLLKKNVDKIVAILQSI